MPSEEQRQSFHFHSLGGKSTLELPLEVRDIAVT